jgi:excisionase family DNA binding protein
MSEQKEIEITISQAAGIVGVNVSTLRRAAAADTLEARKLGPRTWLTTVSAVKRWQANHAIHKRGPKAKSAGEDE